MKAINNRCARQARMIRKLSPTRRVVTTQLRRRQAGPLRCVRIVIICVALGCLLGSAVLLRCPSCRGRADIITTTCQDVRRRTGPIVRTGVLLLSFGV